MKITFHIAVFNGYVQCLVTLIVFSLTIGVQIILSKKKGKPQKSSSTNGQAIKKGRGEGKAIKEINPMAIKLEGVG